MFLYGRGKPWGVFRNYQPEGAVTHGPSAPEPFCFSRDPEPLHLLSNWELRVLGSNTSVPLAISAALRALKGLEGQSGILPISRQPGKWWLCQLGFDELHRACFHVRAEQFA